MEKHEIDLAKELHSRLNERLATFLYGKVFSYDSRDYDIDQKLETVINELIADSEMLTLYRKTIRDKLNVTRAELENMIDYNA